MSMAIPPRCALNRKNKQLGAMKIQKPHNLGTNDSSGKRIWTELERLWKTFEKTVCNPELFCKSPAEKVGNEKQQRILEEICLFS